MAKQEFRQVGKSLAKVDALDKVLGRALYAEDVTYPGMLHGKVVWAGRPHAVIEEIDTGEAMAMEGVACVLTAKDVPGSNRYGIAFADHYALAEGKVRYPGDAVALVAAETEEIAEEAVRAVKVKYRDLPLVSDLHQALSPDSARVHEERDNLILHSKTRKGDIEKGFAQADVIVEETFRTQTVDHAYMETEAGVAHFDNGGMLIIQSGNQCPFRDRRQVASVLGLPENKVRVIKSVTGGAFGGKDDITVEVHLGLLAMATQRPVRLVFSREESLVTQTKRHPIEIWSRRGATKDGKLCALEGRVYGDTGPYIGLGAFVVKKCGIHLCGPYSIPNIKVDSYSVYTNNTFNSAMRGFGVTQAALAHESQMDQLAAKLGINPLNFRLMNALVEGQTTATGQKCDQSVGIKATLETLRKVVLEDPELKDMWEDLA